MKDVDDTTYHIYLKDKPVYYNLSEEDFEEKWQLLNVMIELIKSDYTEEDLSYIKLAPKIGVGGPGKVIEEHSY